MGKHSGAAETTPERTSLRPVLLLALGLTATLVAWGVLVYAAIDFGGEARAGESVAWVFLVLSTIGAAACLFVTLLLGARILALVQGRQPAPAKVQGGRRAAR